MKRLVMALALALAACDDPPPPRPHFTPMQPPDAGPPPEVDAGPPEAPDAGYPFQAPRRPPRPLDEALYKPYLAYANEALRVRQPLTLEVQTYFLKHGPGDPKGVVLARRLNDRWLVLQDQLLVKYDLTPEEVVLMDSFTNDVNRAALIDHQVQIDVAGRAEFKAMPKEVRDALRQQELASNKALRELDLWKKVETTYGTAALALGRRHQVELRRLANDLTLSNAGVMPSAGRPSTQPR
jgi:hypothetical protein